MENQFQKGTRLMWLMLDDGRNRYIGIQSIFAAFFEGAIRKSPSFYCPLLRV